MIKIRPTHREQCSICHIKQDGCLTVQVRTTHKATTFKQPTSVCTECRDKNAGKWRYAEETQEMNWQPIATAPLLRQRILLWCGSVRLTFIGYHFKGKWYGCRFHTPTHWAEITTPRTTK